MRIHQKCSLSTPATALMDNMRVMSPDKARTHREVIPKIEAWQVRVDALHTDHTEQLSEQMRIAALIQMLPGDIRDVACQSGLLTKRFGARHGAWFRTGYR